jgi:hypothetical protein
MKLSTRSLSKFSVLTIVALSVTACGTAVDLLADNDRTAQSEVSSDEETNQNLMDASFAAASGMNNDEFKPYRAGFQKERTNQTTSADLIHVAVPVFTKDPAEAVSIKWDTSRFLQKSQN